MRYKARYVIGRHRDNMKHLLAHDAKNISASSVQLLLALASILSLDVWSTDVCLEFLQSSDVLPRRICIHSPADEFKLNTNQWLELLKPLYGLGYSGDSWVATLR